MSLAEELVNEILTRLPAKSLMRFKSVERSWNTLFKTNSFIRIQKERQMNEDRVIIFYNETGIYDLPKITVVSTCDPPQYETLEFPISHLNYCLMEHITSGYCNGIYCLEAVFGCNYRETNHQYITETVLWNPTTREAKVIPNNPLAPTGNFMCHSGLGVSDPNTFDQFKYIQIYIAGAGADNEYDVVYVELYDLNTQSWFVIHDIHVTRLKSSLLAPGSYSNGLCHWLSLDFTFILCFDFHSNKFRTIKSPLTTQFCRIIEPNNCIAYLVYETDYDYDPPRHIIQIWNLEQDDTWVKRCNIVAADEYVTICAILKDYTEFIGEPLYYYMPLYNSRGQLLRQFQIPARQHIGIYDYVETIAPLSLYII
ncbi:hypothetical protein Lal_00000472 [Lupinus albus]|uniref:Putative F-box domain, galactose oxidase/kelch, beta-propeller, kelch-type beta propeller n=1 Tax=Lupinus albus TaxID=3870 RepID=A0A6A4NPG8_LUPAL|nr:putative F-box domain, galactose oxidase/kelch, beta-propeller, kelch-type beta propeller [Lupinus albus]KAF1861055.1 hypothetical protein Lal_00000472 [Lupinus albus]